MATHAPPTTLPASLNIAAPATTHARPFARVEASCDFAALAEAWQALELTAPASAYQTLRWVRPWAQTVGAAAGIRPLIIAAFDELDRPIALLPLGIVNRGPLRLAEFLGGKDANFTFGLFRPGVPFSRADLIAMLREGCAKAGVRVDAFALVSQPEAWGGVANPLLALAHQPSPSFGYKGKLLADPEACMAKHLSKDARKKLKKKERKLTEAGALSYVAARDRASAQEIMAAFLAQKAVRMAVMGVADVFAQPAQRQFIQSAAVDRAADPDAAIRLYALYAGTRIVATYGCSVHGGRMSGLFNSYDADPEVARSSPGDLLLGWIVREACAAGLTEFDLGVGEARYKGAFCDEEERLFDAYAALTVPGMALAKVKSAKRRVKRFIKTSPQVWALSVRLRKLRG